MSCGAPLGAMRVVPAVLALAVLLVLPAAAQEHEHSASGPVFLAHDLRTTGEAYAGGLAGFAPMFLGDDAIPDPHKQNQVRVSQGGITLFETTADSGHDYDGVAPFLLAIPAAGPFEVASIAGDKVQAEFKGLAAPAPALAATAELELPAQSAAGAAVPIALAAKVPGLVAHSDGIVEVRKDGPEGEVLLRVHAHTHEAPMALHYVFPQPGTYAVRATVYQAYPGGDDTAFVPATVVKAHEVLPGPPPAGPVPVAAMPPAARNAVVEGTTSGGPYRLIGSYDPYTVVGLGTLQHLAVSVMDPATRAPVAHVDFKAEVAGPYGTWWSSASLHEYDGIFELAARAPIPGLHVLKVSAETGAWKGTVEMPFTVLPGLEQVPAAAITLRSPDRGVAANQSADFAFSARDAAGRPVAHSEIDLVVLDPDGNLHLQAKLHTHGDGDFPFTLALPRAGNYRLLASATSLDPNTPLAGAAAFTLGVEPGAAIAAVTGAPTAAATAPGPALALLLAGLAGAVAGMARRQGPAGKA